MKRLLQLFFPLLIPVYGYAQKPKINYPQPPYKIILIDTGYDALRAPYKLKLCKDGHFDYLHHEYKIGSMDVHGTQVASIIAEKLRDVDYCAVIYQVAISTKPDFHYQEVADAFMRASGEGATAINVSLGFTVPHDFNTDAIKDDFSAPTRSRIPVFLAAGNDHKNFDKLCDVYPQCFNFPNFIIVGSQDPLRPREHSYSSNYGKIVQLWAPGGYDDEFGTSYAAPRALSEYILFLEHKRTGK